MIVQNIFSKNGVLLDHLVDTVKISVNQHLQLFLDLKSLHCIDDSDKLYDQEVSSAETNCWLKHQVEGKPAQEVKQELGLQVIIGYCFEVPVGCVLSHRSEIRQEHFYDDGEEVDVKEKHRVCDVLVQIVVTDYDYVAVEVRAYHTQEDVDLLPVH